MWRKRHITHIDGFLNAGDYLEIGHRANSSRLHNKRVACNYLMQHGGGGGGGGGGNEAQRSEADPKQDGTSRRNRCAARPMTVRRHSHSARQDCVIPEVESTGEQLRQLVTAATVMRGAWEGGRAGGVHWEC